MFLVGFLVLLGVVFGRVVQLEVTQGGAFRSQAAQPLVRQRDLPGLRGRIFASDASVLACDKEVLALAVHYRYLEQPANERWLRYAARRRLSKTARKDPRQVAAEMSRLRAERRQLQARLAQLCDLSPEEWNRRARQIQARVERIAESVNRRHRADSGQCAGTTASAATSNASLPQSTLKRLRQSALDALRGSVDELPPSRITVAEERDYHVMAEDISLAVAAEVQSHPESYPGVKTTERLRRDYPFGRLAAHVLGHLGKLHEEELPADDDGYRPDDRVGRMGLERRYERLLRGRRGVAVELTDHSGRVLSSYRRREPGVGRDLILTLNRPLQHSAETLLDEALERRALGASEPEPAGGAIVVMDVHSGAILAAASAPRFDPNLFAGGQSDKLSALMENPAHPLFDRVARMAIPPGSVFKTLSAVALLEAAAVDPEEPFFCQGYLQHPDRLRCTIYRRHGTGHGEVTLYDALAQSCNVYFFHHAGRLAPQALANWASRFGFGHTTGVDLPSEATGILPAPANIRALEGHDWRLADMQATVIGQGSLTATPLQVVRMMAAVANQGKLVTPHLVSTLGLPILADGQSAADLPDLSEDPIRIPPPRPIPGLHDSTLAAIRAGLARVVSDASGTAHGTVFLDSVAVAGKTGTAETGAGREDHAWFAGYVPADRPKLAFCVVLEHSGSGGQGAGPVAKRLVLRMQQLGLL